MHQYSHLSAEELLNVVYAQPTLTAYEFALSAQLELLLNAYDAVCETVYTTAVDVEQGAIAPLTGIAVIKAVVEPEEVEAVYVQ